MKLSLCELCNADASVFCPSDAAFLCWRCDAKVHGANFLVARHVRQSVCSNCKNFTGQGLSGVVFHPIHATCPSCPAAPSEDDLDSVSSSGSSVCISSATSRMKKTSGGRGFESSSMVTSGKRKRPSRSPVDHSKAEGIFVNWCGKIGIEEADLAVRLACKALKVCVDRRTVLPFRVCLAASLLLGMRMSFEKPVLKRLEEISGVPAEILLAAESKLERALKEEQGHRRLELEEGWAESQA